MSEVLSTVIQELDGAKEWQVFDSSESEAVQEGIPNYLAAKGIHVLAVKGLAAQSDLLGRTLDSLLLGNHTSEDNTDSYYNRGRGATSATQRHRYLNAMVTASYAERIANGDYQDAYDAAQGYTGEPSDHISILEAVSETATIHQNHYDTGSQRQFRRNGASRNLWEPRIHLERAQSAEKLTRVPIAVVGCGASGILSAAFLRNLGFRNITVFDKRGRGNGIWGQDNVAKGTKNNPFTINFLGRQELESAANSRYIEGSGQDIANFLDGITLDARVVPRKANIKSIKAGDLRHEITFVEDGETKTETYPIVIYAPGIGEPLDPNDPKRMTTPMKKNEVGQRWQRQLDDDDLAKLGHRAVLIGLGNSTAEVLFQLQKQRRSSVDYRILTHRSLGALINPTKAVGFDTSPIYRDVSRPELTTLAGDLRHINQMFTEARDSGKIVANIRHWYHDGNILTAVDGDGIETRIPFSKLFTLIGYGQNPENNKAMSLTTADKRTGSITYDFDGEVQREEYDDYHNRPRRRVFPGYFALGPILKNQLNPNALVIPGIQYQLQFLASTLVFRAAEYAYGARKPLAAKKLGAVTLG